MALSPQCTPANPNRFRWTTIDGEQYIKCYTDGSCLFPTDPYLAVGGWAVYFHEECASNASAPLRTTVQNSYLAEVRAIAEALACAFHPLVIYSDCQSVVRQVNAFIADGRRAKDHDLAPELWDFIYLALGSALPKDWIVCRWMPGHLDAKHKRAVRDKLLASNDILWEDIRGNVEADRMADAAAKRHSYPASMHEEATIRKSVTMAVQRHLVRSWLWWCDLHREAKDASSSLNEDMRSADAKNYANASRETQGQFLDDWQDEQLQPDPFAETFPAEHDQLMDLDASWEDPFGHMDLDGNDLGFLEQSGGVPPVAITPKHAQGAPASCVQSAAEYTAGGKACVTEGAGVTPHEVPKMLQNNGFPELLEGCVRGGMGPPPDEVPTETSSVGPRNAHASDFVAQVPLITVNDQGGLYCIEKGSSSSSGGSMTSGSAHCPQFSHHHRASPVISDDSATASSANTSVVSLPHVPPVRSTNRDSQSTDRDSSAPLSLSEVRAHHASGGLLTGTLCGIGKQLHQVHPHYSWNNPADACFSLSFRDEIPWKGTMMTRQGLTRADLEALKWWVEDAKFTAFHGTVGDGASHRSRMTTFVEITIALELESGVQLGGPDADLARKVALVRTGLRFLMANCRPKCDNPACKRKLTFEGFFQPRKYVGTLENIIGVRLAGIYRGVAWRHGPAQAEILAACAYKANLKYREITDGARQDSTISGLHDRLPAFGEQYHLRLRNCGIPATWRAPVLVEMESQLLHSYMAAHPLGGQCHFGCQSNAKLKIQSLVPKWRGADWGSKICSKCHYRLVRPTDLLRSRTATRIFSFILMLIYSVQMTKLNLPWIVLVRLLVLQTFGKQQARLWCLMVPPP